MSRRFDYVNGCPVCHAPHGDPQCTCDEQAAMAWWTDNADDPNIDVFSPGARTDFDVFYTHDWRDVSSVMTER